MKKAKNKSSIICLSLIALLTVLLLFTVITPELAFAQPQNKHITVIMRENDDTLFLNMRLGIEQAAQELSADVNIMYPLLSNNHASQVRLIESAIDNKTDAIIIMPADTQEMEQYFNESPSAVPIIYIEAESENNFIGPENKEIGETIASDSLSVAKGDVILLKTAAQSQAVSERLESCYNILQESGLNITILTCNSSDIYYKLPDMLQKTSAKTVIAFEQSATRDMFNATMQSGIKELNLYGIGIEGDIISGLEQEYVAGVVVWNEYAQGYIVLQSAMARLTGNRTLVPQNSEIPFKLITYDEIFSPENQRLLFPVF